MSNPELMKETAKAVQEALQDANRSKKSLSDETGIPYPTLNRKMAAQTEFRFSELLAIAEALGVSPATFTPRAFARQGAGTKAA